MGLLGGANTYGPVTVPSMSWRKLQYYHVLSIYIVLQWDLKMYFVSRLISETMLIFKRYGVKILSKD